MSQTSSGTHLHINQVKVRAGSDEQGQLATDLLRDLSQGPRDSLKQLRQHATEPIHMHYT